MVRVGVLHSLTGSMAMGEVSLRDATLMAIAEINQTSGVMGQMIEPVMEDGASNPDTFERCARKLLQQDQVVSVFGCWTSLSRKAVLGTFEELGGLLWYPSQYEGLEQSPNIFYTGSCPNQQVEPAVDWLLQQRCRRFFLLGSDYVFPRTMNKIVRGELRKCQGQVVGEAHVPLGTLDFTSVLRQIQELQPDMVINTLNGDSNIAFYRQYQMAGLTADQIPVLAMTELRQLDPSMVGHYLCSSYLQTVDSPKNRGFVDRFLRYQGFTSVVTDGVEAAYSQVYLWKQAVEVAQSFEADRVRCAAVGQIYEAPGGVVKVEANQHLWKPCQIGRISPTGQFEIVFSSEASIKPLPWLGVEEQAFSGSEVVIDLLAEVSRGIQYSWQLEQQSQELQAALQQLQNEIVERQRTEVALQAAMTEAAQNAAELQALFSAMTELIVIRDAEGRCLKVAPTSSSLLLRPASEQIGLTLQELLPSKEAEILLNHIRQCLETRRPVGFEYCLQMRGQQVWQYATISPLSENTVMLVVRDISDRKQIEEDYRQAMLAAETANRAKSIFLANMSHELRTPLNAILGFTQLLSRDATLSPKQQKHLDTINRSGEHLLTLINDVLEMSKIEAGRTTVNESDFGLPGLLNWLQEMFELKAQSRGLQLNIEPVTDLPDYIRADESKLRQVLVNLLGNAVKFTEEGGVALRIGIRKSGSSPVGQETVLEQDFPHPVTLDFEVEDTGPGIDPADLEHLFEPFVQTESGRKAHEGTGLGLAISQKFVQLMGGEMTVLSTPDRGTIFRFCVQAQAIEAIAPIAPTSRQKVVGLEPGQPTWRILVVDDKPENRELLVELLSPVGFEVQESGNGEAAIAQWQQWSPDLIWMDIRMPVMDGYEAIRQIHRISQTTQKSLPVIIALTGSVFEEDRREALALGCKDFVKKPFRTEVIFEKMEEYLGVRYLYSTSSTPPRSSTSGQTEGYFLTPDKLSIMPAEWVAQLHHAATRMNSKLVLQLIEQIPEDVTSLKAALAQRVEDFCIEEIVELTQQCVSRPDYFHQAG